METGGYQRPGPAGTRRPGKGAMRRLAREHGSVGADSLAALVRERAERASSGSPQELLRLDAEIDRLAGIHEAIETRNLNNAATRLDTLQRQALFVNLAIGLVAVGATAAAFQRRPRR